VNKLERFRALPNVYDPLYLADMAELVTREDLPERGNVTIFRSGGPDNKFHMAQTRYSAIFDDYSVSPAVIMLLTKGGLWKMESLCPYGCGEKHIHGALEGHRKAHCTVKREHPEKYRGYFIFQYGAGSHQRY
jgi:hypothetical protein